MSSRPRRRLLTAFRALGRGTLKHCPRCGQGKLYRAWFRLLERCPRCHLRFEREEGMWAGALIVNLAVTELLFVIVVVAGLALTWPDVRVLPLTLVCVAINVVTPVVFYPWSKTIWLAIDLIMHGSEVRR